MPDPLYQRIYQTVSLIPPGKVASYGQVAAATGLFRGARIVGWALKQLPSGTSVPWQRVINQKGEISIVNPQVPQSVQRDLLASEGHEIIQEHGVFKLINPDWHRF